MGLQNEKIAALSFVTADLNYLAPPLDRPRTYTFEPPSGEPKSNIVPEPHSVPIHDIRPIGDTVSLDREGFALVRQNSSVKDFYDEDEVRSVYYPEAERLIKAATGAIPSANAFKGRLTFATAARVNPWRACMSTTPRSQVRSAFAISFRTRPKNC